MIKAAVYVGGGAKGDIAPLWVCLKKLKQPFHHTMYVLLISTIRNNLRNSMLHQRKYNIF
jgi:hypothetical protein